MKSTLAHLGVSGARSAAAWAHAISRSVMVGLTADDRALSSIEKFLDIAQRRLYSACELTYALVARAGTLRLAAELACPSAQSEPE